MHLQNSFSVPNPIQIENICGLFLPRSVNSLIKNAITYVHVLTDLGLRT